MPVEIRMLPITEGDATLIVDRLDKNINNTVILIDTGRKKDEVMSLLVERGITKIDLLLLSHIDLDHIGGMESIVDNLEVRNIWCFDIYRLKEALQPGSTSSQIRRNDTKVPIDHIIYRLLTADIGLRKSIIKGVPCWHVEEGHQEIFGRLGIEVLWPPKEYVDFVLTPKRLRNFFMEKRPPTEWIITKGEEGQEIEIDRREAQRRAKKRLTENQMLNAGLEQITEKEYSDYEGISWPGEHFANNLSIVVQLTVIGDVRTCPLLFSGDLEDWSGLIAKHAWRLQAGIWKLPHHGSDNVEFDLRRVFTEEFFRQTYERLPRPWRYVLREYYYNFIESGEETLFYPWLLSPFFFPSTFHFEPFKIAGGLPEIARFIKPTKTLVFPFPGHGLPSVSELETGFLWGEVISNRIKVTGCPLYDPGLKPAEAVILL